MKRLLAALAGLAALWGAQGHAQEVIRVASFTPEQAVGVRFVMKPWMEAVQADAGDKVTMQGFWGGSLGRNPFKQYELVRDGIVDVAWVLTAYTPGQFSQLQVMELPFGVKTGEEASVVGWRLFEQGNLKGFEDIKIITVWNAEPAVIHTVKPIDSLDQVKNLRLRTVGSVQGKFVEALGGAPQAMSSTEANEAAMRGAIDGLVQGWTGMRTFKSFQVVNGSFDVPFGAFPFLLVMNKAKWESLPPDVQAAIMKHGGEGLARQGGQAYDRISKEIQQEKEADPDYTVIRPAASDLTADKVPYKKVHEQWVADTEDGQRVYDLYMKILDEYRTSG